MPNNLLIVPLLAGYLFVHLCARLRYRCQSLDGYRLLLESAVAGAILLVIARLLALGIAQIYPPTSIIFQQLAPTVPFAGTATLCLLLGVALPLIHNRIPHRNLTLRIVRNLLLRRNMRLGRRAFIRIKRTAELNRKRAIAHEILHGNALVRLIYEACEHGRLVSVGLTNRKWYVGYVAEAVNLEPRELYFRLLPVLSGYRDKDTLQACQSLDYREVYKRLADEVDLTDFVVTLALADVQDARLFDDVIYQTHFGQKSPILQA